MVNNADINECEHKEYPCRGICEDTSGSYECKCPRGTHSADPLNIPCSPNFPLAAKITIGTYDPYFISGRWSTLCLYKFLIYMNIEYFYIIVPTDSMVFKDNYIIERPTHVMLYLEIWIITVHPLHKLRLFRRFYWFLQAWFLCCLCRCNRWTFYHSSCSVCQSSCQREKKDERLF